MPIHHKILEPSNVIHTILSGRVTDEELLSYYQQPMFLQISRPWWEIVDGRGITEMAITPAGQRTLATLASAHRDKLQGGRVAMVAGTDLIYGMFRMWEMQRAGLGYEVQVFRDFDEALEWIRRS